MAYKLTFTTDEATIARLTEKGCYPFQIGPHAFSSGEELEVESIFPFISDVNQLKLNPRLTEEAILSEGLIDPRLTVELI